MRSVGGVPVEIRLKDGAAASFARITWHASSPLAAIRRIAPAAHVSFVDGTDPAAAAAAAKSADLAIVFATQWRTEAQDVGSLRLPDNQDALIAAVAAANPRAIVVLETGGPVLMPWLNKVSAVMQAWYPGQRGGEAIADILFGAVNPSGHLPMTFPASPAQAPRPDVPGLAEMKTAAATRKAELVIRYAEGAAVGYRSYLKSGQTPQFPFGFGLSYARFRYARLQVAGGDTVHVSFDVTNTGQVAGADVPQVYVTAGRRDGATTRLIGFQRIELRPGETRRVALDADPRLIADYEPSAPGWHIAAGAYRVAVGHYAGDAALTGSATLRDIRLHP